MSWKKDEVCSICGRKLGALTKTKLTDGFLCKICRTWCSDFAQIKSMSVADARAHIEKTMHDDAIYKSLVPTESIGKYLIVFLNERLWSCMVSEEETPYLFSFDDIIKYELLEDGATVTSGGIGSAAVGAVLFGGVGAIVGGGLGKKQKDVVSKVSIRISTRVPFMSHIEIPLLTSAVNRSGFAYKSCKETAARILSLLDQITLSSTAPISTQGQPPAYSVADEILKFKQLLDDGIITAEEFEAKKRQLLGL